MSAIQDENLEGSTLGKYKIVQRIGAGNMASVFLGHDPFIDRPVAIKVARPDYVNENAGSEFYRRLFFNEAQTAGLLKHPNITAIYDAGVDRGFYYIVMEYVHGGKTLEGYTAIDNLLPLDKVTSILYQCAMALDYAHRRGVIHRDIKPRNILLTEELEAKISDFGVAATQGTHGDAAEQAGSPLYMSPEQVRRDEISTQSDLFSLGVVIYEMLTGKHPFHAENIEAIEHRILNSPPPRLEHVRADIPGIYQRIVDRALAKKLSHRYKTGLDMAGDIALVFDFLKQPAVRLTQQEKYHRVEGLEFFKGFPDNDLWELINAAEWVRLSPGNEIVQEGQADASFYVLVGGEVRVNKAGRDIVRLFAGDCFGEMGLLSRRPRTSTITAIDDVTVMKLRDTVVDRMSINCQLRFQRRFLTALIERLEHATERLAEEPPDDGRA
ncbi:MAG: protein kinase domain-containing protein [Gammaproteobacteria bacterium]